MNNQSSKECIHKNMILPGIRFEQVYFLSCGHDGRGSFHTVVKKRKVALKIKLSTLCGEKTEKKNTHTDTQTYTETHTETHAKKLKMRRVLGAAGQCLNPTASIQKLLLILLNVAGKKSTEWRIRVCLCFSFCVFFCF